MRCALGGAKKSRGEEIEEDGGEEKREILRPPPSVEKDRNDDQPEDGEELRMTSRKEVTRHAGRQKEKNEGIGVKQHWRRFEGGG